MKEFKFFCKILLNVICFLMDAGIMWVSVALLVSGYPLIGFLGLSFSISIIIYQSIRAAKKL